MSKKNSNRQLTAKQIEAELRRVRSGNLKTTGTNITTKQLQEELKRVRGIKSSQTPEKKSESTILEKPEKSKTAKTAKAEKKLKTSGTTDVIKKPKAKKSDNKAEEAVKPAAAPQSMAEIAERQREIDALFSAAQLETELKRAKKKKEFGRMIRETIIILLGVAAAAVLVSVLFLPVLRVTGSSMEKTLYSNDIVVCQKGTEFKRGEIIAFYFNNRVLLKRVIGLSGDVVDISENGTVTVNGEQLNEPYVTEPALGEECDIEFPYHVPDKRIFVLGDHRSTSIDSRSSSIGCIAEEYIVGKVILRVWPFERVGTVK